MIQIIKEVRRERGGREVREKAGEGKERVGEGREDMGERRGVGAGWEKWIGWRNRRESFQIPYKTP